MLQFMIGRNGNDELNRFLLMADMVLILLSLVFSKWIGRILSPLVLVLLCLTYYRMLSRDLIRISFSAVRPVKRLFVYRRDAERLKLYAGNAGTLSWGSPECSDI